MNPCKKGGSSSCCYTHYTCKTEVCPYTMGKRVGPCLSNSLSSVTDDGLLLYTSNACRHQWDHPDKNLTRVNSDFQLLYNISDINPRGKVKCVLPPQAATTRFPHCPLSEHAHLVSLSIPMKSLNSIVVYRQHTQFCIGNRMAADHSIA